jgi:predicted nucleic acid-binding protein
MPAGLIATAQEAGLEKFGLDANILSFAVKPNDTRYVIVRRKIFQMLDAQHLIYTPPFAYHEVRRWLEAKGAAKRLRDLENLCLECPVGTIDNSIFTPANAIYVDLWHKGRRCDDANDLYIAAFCKMYGLTLVTNNTAHFQHIDGLNLADWSCETAAMTENK